MGYYVRVQHLKLPVARRRHVLRHWAISTTLALWYQLGSAVYILRFRNAGFIAALRRCCAVPSLLLRSTAHSPTSSAAQFPRLTSSASLRTALKSCSSTVLRRLRPATSRRIFFSAFDFLNPSLSIYFNATPCGCYICLSDRPSATVHRPLVRCAGGCTCSLALVVSAPAR